MAQITKLLMEVNARYREREIIEKAENAEARKQEQLKKRQERRLAKKKEKAAVSAGLPADFSIGKTIYILLWSTVISFPRSDSFKIKQR